MYNTESKRTAKVKTTFEVLERGYLTVSFCFEIGVPGIFKEGIFFSHSSPYQSFLLLIAALQDLRHLVCKTSQDMLKYSHLSV
jgi:hypothetical protein